MIELFIATSRRLSDYDGALLVVGWWWWVGGGGGGRVACVRERLAWEEDLST
jgi:hypothetical protein